MKEKTLEERAKYHMKFGYKKDWGDGYVCNDHVIILRRETEYSTIIAGKGRIVTDYAVLIEGHPDITFFGVGHYRC